MGRETRDKEAIAAMPACGSRSCCALSWGMRPGFDAGANMAGG